MKEVKVTLEVITPMFSHGSNKKEPEFRITELKSLMRNTFRELYNFEQNHKEDKCTEVKTKMKDREEELFGGTNKKAPVSFKVNFCRLKNESVPMLPHRKEEGKRIKRKCINNGSQINEIGTKINKIKNLNELLNIGPVQILKDTERWLINNNQKRSIQLKEGHNKTVIFLDNYNGNLGYPYIKKIYVIDLKDNNYYKKIEQVSSLTHERIKNNRGQIKFIERICNKEYIDFNILGNCTSNERIACPIVVSFWSNKTGNYMIIKELNYGYMLREIYLKNQKKAEYEKFSAANEAYVNKYIENLIEIARR